MNHRFAPLVIGLAALIGLLMLDDRPPRTVAGDSERAGWTVRLAPLLGPGRLVIRDVLWFRLIDDLTTRPWRARGEMEVLVRLSPHDVQAWKFLGEYLAFSIAAATIDPQEQAAWVDEAIQRFEEGLRYNPESRDLHYSLARVLTPAAVIDSYRAEPDPREERALSHLEAASAEPDPLTDALMLRGTLFRRRAGRSLLAGQHEDSMEQWRRASMTYRRLASIQRALAADLAADTILLTEALSDYCLSWSRLIEDPSDDVARAAVEVFAGDEERGELLERLERR